MRKEWLYIIALLVTMPLAIGSGLVLWVACKIGAFDGLMLPYYEDEWRELLSLIGFATVCIIWMVALVSIIRQYWDKRHDDMTRSINR